MVRILEGPHSYLSCVYCDYIIDVPDEWPPENEEDAPECPGCQQSEWTEVFV